MPLWKGWSAYLDGQKYTVEIEHGRLRNISIKVNGNEVLTQKTYAASVITIGDHILIIKVEYRFFFYKYDLFIDGYSPYTNTRATETMAAWKRALILAAAFIFGFLFGLIGIAVFLIFLPFICLGFTCCSNSRKKKGPEEPQYTPTHTGVVDVKTSLIPQTV
eukprot:TRINITY_DN7233_c0_g1_i1.p1 TRINITY_DN7233_c0_g1~~TRINITY_DN7233_c0_g1_i1.p1  ORF type:complete len:162 (-),score=14.38 TRINITY_DN7233_c0_g1_i1:73-558(-)